MRLASLEIRIAVLASLLLAASACQTAQKPVSLMPPGSAPALQPAPPPPPVPAQTAATQAQDAPAQKPAAPEAAPDQTSALTPDPVADLITRAEKEYQAGVANYHAGQHDDAKQHFDNALNALLSSNLDVRSDDRLQKEFDHIVQGVNELYPGGPSADSDQPQEAQQKSEPAPIDITNDATNGVTPAADAGVAAKAQAEIKHTHSDLPLMMTDQVAGYITYFSGRGRGVFERAFARSGRYHDMIATTLKEEGVPQDLIYLAQAESGFHPLAVSRAGARGIWQFMAARGRGYGLYHNQWVDDRQDPEKSTRAAARHLKDLYNQFGDWYLAMAAYNSGPGTVQAAVKRTGYADFWELYRRNVLPKETRNYVPIILALTLIAKDPARYGMDVDPDAPPPVESVQLSHPVDLRLVAETLDVDLDELRALNPQLLRLVTPADPKFVLSVPAGTADDFNAQMASIPPDKWTLWRRHRVEEGETLSGIARKYNVKAADLLEVNGLDSPASLDPGTKLIVPISAQAQPAAGRLVRYRVHGNDTLATVADEFDVSTTELKKWNNLRTDRVPVGTHLRIYPGGLTPPPEVAQKPASNPATMAEWRAAPKPAGSTAREAVTHRVQNGETLYSIARAYQTTVDALRKGNEFLFSRPLQAGDTLTILPAR
jgi:membrane-bound lytic murein transglycosylase D